MREWDDFQNIVLAIWLIGLVYAGVLLFDQFKKSAPQEAFVDYTPDLVQQQQKHMDFINAQDRKLMQAQQQRIRDHQQLSANLRSSSSSLSRR